MPIVAGDIETRLSGGASNSDPNASLGGAMSSTVWTGGTLHDLFDVITGDENANEVTDYRCIYVVNTHDTLTWIGVKVWISDQVAGGANCSIGLDPAGVGDGAITGVATTISVETDAPSGVSFSAPASKEEGLTIGDIAPGEAAAVWIRRTATNSEPMNDDGVTLMFEGDTQA